MPDFPVFTSYAQADREKHLDKFVADFREQLGGLLGEMDHTAVVFFDRDGVKAGDAWSSRIIDTLRHAKVLVCLMSPTYLGREWCGRELGLFLRRLGQLQLPVGTSTRFIFPIWWQMPVAARPLPSLLGQWHYRDAQFPPRYEALGVKGLARAALWKQFRQMVDRLAQLVGETLAGPHYLPPGDAIADISEIANAFDEQQEFDVRLLALTTGGDAWCPGATDVTISEAAAQSARRLQIFIRRVEMGAGLQAGLKKAQDERQIVLLVVDAALGAQAALAAVNGVDLQNLAVLLVDAASPVIGADAWLGLFPVGALQRAKEAGFIRVACPGGLASEMEMLIDEVRRRLRVGQQAMRAEDPALATRAKEQGIEIDVQPHLKRTRSRYAMNVPNAPEAIEDAPARAPGRIITFYSYKGGTGRTMALANAAWILAANGYRVLAIDWDFEAPGLHRYFCPFLSDSELSETPGLIDCFVHFAEAARSQSSHVTSLNRTWFEDRADLIRYSVALEYEFGDGGYSISSAPGSKALPMVRE